MMTLKSKPIKTDVLAKSIRENLNNAKALPESETLRIINETVGPLIGCTFGYMTDHNMQPIGVCIIATQEDEQINEATRDV